MNAKHPELRKHRAWNALCAAALLLASTCATHAAPVFQDMSAVQSGTGNVTVPWPTHEIGDIALLFIESSGGQAANLGTPATFVNVTNSPQDTGATRLTVYWARATSTSMASPIVTDPGNHVYAQIITYRDALESGNPWSITGGGTDGSADVNADVASISPTHADTLVVQAVAIETDSATPAFGTPANVNLAGILTRSAGGTSLGNGGGIAIWDGVKATAGATGTTTLTTPSSDHAFLSIALRPTTTYYSRVATGNWATGTTWSTAGCGGASAGATPAAGTHVVICSGHTITLNTNSAAVRSLTIQNTGVLNIGNDGTARTLTVTGAVSNAGTLRYNTAAAHVANFGNTFLNTGTVTTAAVAGNKSMAVTGLLTNSGTFDLAGNGVFTLNANGGLTNDSSLSFTSAQNHVVNVTGDFSNTGTVTAGAVAGTKTITVSGLTTNSGTFQLAGNGVFTLNANGGLTNSNSMSFTTGQNHLVNVTGAFNNSGTFTSAAVGGARTLTVSGLITNTGTLRFAGTAAMTVNANGGITNDNTLDVSAASNTTHQLNVVGDFTNNGTVNFTPDGDSFVATTFNGGAVQNITGTAGSTTFYNLTLNNANGLTLSGTHNATVSNTLTLTSGRLTTGSNVVYVSSGNAVAGAGASTFVVGNLRKEFAASTNVTRNFEVGTETGGVRYAPVAVTLANVTGAGGLTVSTTAGDHANIAASNLDSTLSINRYWTLSGNSTVFDDDVNNSITFTFVDPDDYDPGADFNAFLVGKYDGSWTETTPTNRTNTTATISDADVTAAAIDSDYQIAELLVITPSSGITVTLNEAASEINAGSLTLTNTTLGPPELTATGTNSGSSSITTNIAATIANSWLVDIVGSGDAGAFVDQTPSQPEAWDESAASATGAMSTKTVVGASSMTQDFGVAASRMAHAVMLVPPLSGATIIFDGTASSQGTNVGSLNWNHPLGTTNLTRAKIIVGVALEDEDCAIDVTAVTYGNVQLTRAAEAEIDTGLCARVEIWWGDLTPIIINTSTNSTLGGQAMDQDEAVRYTAVANTGTLFLDDALFAPLDPNMDGLSLMPNGNIALSFSGNVTFQSNTVENGDIFEMTPTGTFVQFLFDENSFTSNQNVDSAYVRDNGHIILSTAAAATFVGGAGGLSMDDDDLVEWDPGTGTATLFFDLGSVVGGAFNVDGVTLLDDDPDLILFSLTANATLGGVNYLDGDVVLYDRNTGNFSRYFSESNFTSGNEQTSAFTLPRAVVIPPPIAQFDISYGATGSTCLSSEILVTAEDIAGNTLTNYGGTVALSTSTGNGDWSKLNQSGGASSDPALGTLSPGANDSGAADYTFLPTDLGTIALFLSNQHAESLTITVFDSTAGVFSTSTVPLTFSDNVFVITPSTCTGGTCPGTGSSEVVAGRDHGFRIAMYRRDISQNPANCGVATNYTGPRSLKAWISRNGSDPGGPVPALAEQTGALGDGAAPGADNLALDFTATPGQSDFTLQTADVGKYTINVRDDSGTFAGVNIDGSSQVLTARPFGIGFTGLTGDIPNPAATTPAGSVFAKAGADFAAVVGAYQWSGGDDAGNDGVPDPGTDVTDNGLTSSYAWLTTVTALLNTPTAAQGGVLGPFNNGAVAQGSFSAGSASVANFQYLEVGSIRLDAAATGYLGSGGVDISGSSGVVGRFAADHFDFVINTAPQLGAACTAFTYVDQGFDFSNTPQITARALDESSSRVLQNYHDFGGAGGDNWWLLNLGTGVSQLYADAAAPAEVSLVDAAGYSPTGGSGVNGQVQFTLTGPFEYDDRGAAPYGPIDTFDAQVALDFAVTDSDGATGSLNINPIAFSNPEQRWGRMIIGTGVGSELLPLALPMRTEYFDSGAFVPNADDTCTSVAAAELVLTSDVEGPITGDTVQIRPGATTTATIANDPFVQGQAGLSFSPPGEGMTGYAEVTLDLGASGEDWLRFDRDGGGVPDDDPSGRAVFGVFGGNDRLIYTREPWN